MMKNICLSADTQGVSPMALLPNYKALFIPSHDPPFLMERDDKWNTIKRGHLHDRRLRSHILGGPPVGVCGREFTNVVTIDLDDGPDLHQRYNACREALPESTPIVQSTPHNGLHLIYPLHKTCWTRPAVEFVKGRLTDVEIRDGNCEINPSKRGLRAPMGAGCNLLDADDLIPKGTRDFGLVVFENMLRREQYDTLEIDESYRPIEQPSTHRHVRRARGPSDFMQEIDRLQRVGLTGPNQRNAALLKLSWMMHVVWGFDHERTAQELWTWTQANHNGHSRSFNAGHAKLKCWDIANAHSYESHAPSRHEPVHIIEFVETLGLDDRAKSFYTKVLTYAENRGEIVEGKLQVEIPSLTMKSFDWKYGAVLKSLLATGQIEKGPNYGAQIHRCQAYRTPLLQRLPPLTPNY
jgi:hypothetical protein